MAGIGVVAATMLTTVLPWGRSGERVRSSYELVTVATDAGVLPDGIGWVASCWFFVPALAGVALVGSGLGRRLVFGVAATTLGSTVGVGGLLVWRSPLGIEPGATAALVVGPVTAALGIVAMVATLTGSTR